MHNTTFNTLRVTAIPFMLTLGGSVMAAGINQNQQAIANVVNAQCRAEVPNPLCSIDLNNNSNLESLNPDQVFGMGSQATRVNGGKVMQPVNSFSFMHGKRGGGAGDDDFSRLNIWGKVDSNFGSRSSTSSQTGFGFDNESFNIGVDYRLKSNWVVGSSFAYRRSNASFDSSRGTTTSDSYTGSVYTTYAITDNLHVEATASYGGFSYATARNINLTGLGASVAKGSPDGNQYAFSWGGGYDFNIKALTIAPYVRGEYIHQGIDSYGETGSIGAMSFEKQTIESLTSTLGVQTAYTFNFAWGILMPQLRGEWHHQFMDGERQINGSFVVDPNKQSISFTGEAPSRDYYTFGAEISSVFKGGLSAFLAYETLQGYTTINSNRLMLGARWEF